MRIRSLYLAVTIISVIFISFAVTSFTGLWKTTNNKIPVKFDEGEFSGQYDPADIRGSYTFGDISNIFEIPLEDLGIAFGLKDPSRYASFKCNELEAIYAYSSEEGMEIGTGSVRYFVALYKGLPYEPTEAVYLPETAVSVLKEKVILSEEQLKYLESHSVDIINISAEEGIIEVNEADDTIIKGSTTFKELLDWGVKREDVEKILNEEISDIDEKIKDYASGRGIEFEELKGLLQALVDKLN